MAGCEPSRRTAVGEITGMLVTALPIQIFFTQSNYNTIVLAQHTVTHTESNQRDHCLEFTFFPEKAAEILHSDTLSFFSLL